VAKKTPSRKTAVTKKPAAKAAKPAKPVKKAAPKAAKAAAKAPARKAAPKAAPAKKAAKIITAKATIDEQMVVPRGKIRCPLSKKELAEYREMLLIKRRTLVGDMNGMEAEAFRSNRQDGAGDLSTMPVHMADIGTDNYEQEFTLGLLESERLLLREINEALDRIEKGIYGICMGTGQPIGVPRLRAKPWAKFCIEYARKVEQGLVRQPTTSYAPSDDDDAEDEDADEVESEAEEIDIDDELAAQEAEEDLSL
jgi:RNA polymerase-binding protein DksA